MTICACFCVSEHTQSLSESNLFTAGVLGISLACVDTSCILSMSILCSFVEFRLLCVDILSDCNFTKIKIIQLILKAHDVISQRFQ